MATAGHVVGRHEHLHQHADGTTHSHVHSHRGRVRGASLHNKETHRHSLEHQRQKAAGPVHRVKAIKR